jgi:hypothetical protein
MYHHPYLWSILNSIRMHKNRGPPDESADPRGASQVGLGTTLDPGGTLRLDRAVTIHSVEAYLPLTKFTHWRLSI